MQFSKTVEGFWLARRREFSPHTVRDYSTTFERFQEFVNNAEFKAIDSDHVHEFLNYLSDELELSNKTISNYWTALSSLWTWAEEQLSAEHIIRHHVKRPRYRSPRPEAFTEREVRLILGAVDHMQAWVSSKGRYVKGARPTAARDRAIIMVLLDTGIRVSELVDLRVGDYDPNTGLLNIRSGKGDKQRAVFLGQAGKSAIWRYLAESEIVHNKAPLFQSRTGNKLDRIAVLRMVKRTGQRCGVDNVHPHRFRHTFAITFLRNGGNALELQRLLGHEKLDTVQIYVELAQIDLQRAQSKASPVDNWKL